MILVFLFRLSEKFSVHASYLVLHFLVLVLAVSEQLSLCL